MRFMDTAEYYTQDITIKRRGSKVSITRNASSGFGLKPAFLRGTLTVHSFSVDEIDSDAKEVGIWGRLAYIRNREFYSDPVAIIIAFTKMGDTYYGSLDLHIIYEAPPATGEELQGRFWDVIKEIVAEVI